MSAIDLMDLTAWQRNEIQRRRLAGWPESEIVEVAKVLFPPPPTNAEIMKREAAFQRFVRDFDRSRFDPHWWARVPSY